MVTADLSDFSSSDESDSERGGEGGRAEGGRRGPRMGSRSTAEEPEIVRDGTLVPLRPSGGEGLGGGSGNGTGASSRRKMIPISDPSLQPELQLPLLRGRRPRGVRGLLPAAAQHSPAWPWVTSAKRLLNPPLVATFGGLVLGLSPFGAPCTPVALRAHAWSTCTERSCTPPDSRQGPRACMRSCRVEVACPVRQRGGAGRPG